MGASNGKDQPKIIKKEESFDQNDLDIVKKSWKSIENVEEFGVSIMIYIFKEHKEIKNKWIFAANLETEAEIRQNSQTKYHAKKIIDIIQLLLSKLQSIDDLSNEELNTKLFRLGESHYHYTVTPDHLPVTIKILCKYFNLKI